MYFSNEVLPEVEVFLDWVASNLTGNETIKDENSYNIGRYNGCVEIVHYVMKELGWNIEIAVDADGKHMIVPVENES